MIQKQRIKALNETPIRKGKYVLYWMQAAQRATYNHALEYAVRLANDRAVPLVVLFCLTDGFPEATLRHYYFMLEGLREVSAALKDRGIQFVLQCGSPPEAAARFSRSAAVAVVDAGQLRIQRTWRKRAAKESRCLLYEVETNLIVPVEEASTKENYSAGTFRPRITKKLPLYLAPLRHRKPKKQSLRLRFDGVSLDDLQAVLSGLQIDRSVSPVDQFHGGPSEARRRLRSFIRNKLDNYAEEGGDPAADCISHMSPYLHFGQISPLEIAREVQKTESRGVDAFLEELIVRRELSHNFVFYNDMYDTYECLPDWARKTLETHENDKREHLYEPDAFEKAQTHDPYWNAAQWQLVITGKMHGYMRMYWGKKLLEWSPAPRDAFATALYLNNKYELDGRDPNAFAGVAWCFGKHDRAWAERPVFGKVRYMNAAGLKRKFDADRYVARIDGLRT